MKKEREGDGGAVENTRRGPELNRDDEQRRKEASFAKGRKNEKKRKRGEGNESKKRIYT